METSRPGTDDWLLMQLAAEYGQGLPRLKTLQSYTDGTCLVPIDSDPVMRRAYLKFVKRAKVVLGHLTVDARVNRMRPLGFRTAAANDDNGDLVAESNWNRSNMKVGARDFFRDAGTYGRGYLVTTGPTVPSADAQPLIVRNSPWQMHGRPETLRPWLLEHAIMLGYDAINEAETITLLGPGWMRTAARSAVRSTLPGKDGDGWRHNQRWSPGRDWAWVSDRVPLGYTQRTPAVHMEMEGGLGVFEPHLDTLDRINAGILERITIAAMQAFRQRGIKGKLPQHWPEGHPQAGQKIDYDEIYKAGPAALWVLPEGAEIWESTLAQLDPLIAAPKEDIRTFAGVTNTPFYVLYPESTNGSAEGATLAREGLVFATEEMIDRAEVPLNLAQALNFEALGDLQRADVGQLETMWGPIERHSLQQQAQASQAAKGQLPQEMIDEKIFHLTPAERRRARDLRDREQFEQALPSNAGAA